MQVGKLKEIIPCKLWKAFNPSAMILSNPDKLFLCDGLCDLKIIYSELSLSGRNSELLHISIYEPTACLNLTDSAALGSVCVSTLSYLI